MEDSTRPGRQQADGAVGNPDRRLPAAPLRLSGQRAFLLFLAGRLVATAGNQVVSLYLAWRLYELTGSAWMLGLFGLLQFLSSLVMFLPAGDAADRHDRRRVLIAAMAAQAGLCLLLLLAEGTNRLGPTLVLTAGAALGGLRPFQMTAQQALAPQLVPAPLLPRALSLSSAGSQGMFIAGPALGGLALVWGPVPTLALALGLNLCAAVLYARMRPAAAPPPTLSRSLSSLLAGVGYVRGQPAILGALTLDLVVVMLGSVVALMPVYAKDVLQLDSAGLGLLRAAPAAGALLMSLALVQWPVRRRVGRVMFLSVGVYALAMLGFGMSTTLWLSLALLALGGAADMVSVVIRQTLVQLDTPDSMRGRVSALNALCIIGSNQLGEFRAGAAAAWFGPAAAVWTGALASLLVAGLWARRFPALWRRDRLVQE
jgi:MFS family permease